MQTFSICMTYCYSSVFIKGLETSSIVNVEMCVFFGGHFTLTSSSRLCPPILGFHHKNQTKNLASRLRSRKKEIVTCNKLGTFSRYFTLVVLYFGAFLDNDQMVRLLPIPFNLGETRQIQSKFLAFD